MKRPLPDSVTKFGKKYPKIWQSFQQLASECHESGGPLDERARRLVKLGIAIGTEREGAVHSATRLALDSGISPDEIAHTAILAITTIGWPGAQAALTWVTDILSNTSAATGTPGHDD